jgi:LacI family transcriptional regulator
VDVFLGGAPLLEPKIAEGLIEFGLHHPQWRFSMRGPDFRYTRDWLQAQSISGVLVLIDDKGMARTLNAAGMPWVHLLPGRPVPQPCINVDDRSIGRLGAEFFLGKGFLRCAFCGVGTPWSDQRARGFRARLKEAGRDCEMIDIPFSQDRDWGLASGSFTRLRKWIAGLDRGIAVMAAHDALANRVVDLCVQEGLRVPQDCAVLGVGNHELLCRLSPVPISSIDAAVPRAAVCAGEMLAAMIGGHPPPAIPPIPPQGVVERRSTEILVYGDDLVGRVVAHIREHAGDKIAVEDLLKIFPVSRRTLTRRFAAFVGQSPAAEIRQARLRQARHLLANSRLSVTEIAAACGYADLPHMNRAFQKAYCDSPGALRAKG